jgi:hypothetical protein
MTLILQFLLAHIIGDFFLQTNKLVRKKEQQKLRSAFLYVHALIHGLLILLITGDPGLWKEAAVIAALHLVIDACKLLFQTDENKRRWFITDQILHIAVLAAVWAIHEQIPFSFSWIQNEKVLAVIIALLFVTKPASLIIKLVISAWSPRRSPNQLIKEVESLENAGQLIGIMERLLIVLFILLNRWEGVGFLLGAKSIFRFGDLTEAKDTRLTEYVLIGTLLSFILAIAAGLLTRYVFNH